MAGREGFEITESLAFVLARPRQPGGAVDQGQKAERFVRPEGTPAGWPRRESPCWTREGFQSAPQGGFYAFEDGGNAEEMLAGGACG